MIAYIKGIVADVSESILVLECGQIGYQLLISSRDAQAMPRPGEHVKVHTYLNVREDAMTLFGFLSKDDLDVFKLLLNVSGIGPKAALGVLSALTADDLRFAVLSEDAKAIAKAPGIGSKTAKKLILELKDKMSLEDAFEKKMANAQVTDANVTADASSEAVQALTALGYSGSDALRAVRRLTITEDMDTETILKLALKQMI